jgi:predicted RNA-binding Zn-ribbon protein involved in translation (DUF1610 family)
MSDNTIKAKCDYCGDTFHVTSRKNKGLEKIEFVCPNCGKHGILLAYDMDLGKMCPVDDKQSK